MLEEKYSFATQKGAQAAGPILSRQLQRFEGVKTEAKASGKEVSLKISSKDEASVRASTYTAARLAKLMQELDRV